MMLSEEENNRLEQLFCRLAKSKFRSRFKLMEKEREYLQDKGLLVIEKYARVFIMERLAPALPKNDGKQTPMKNHPVFIDQHSTATCCRKCLGKWHRIERDKKLTTQQIDYVVSVIMYWLRISTTCSDSSKLKYSIYYRLLDVLSCLAILEDELKKYHIGSKSKVTTFPNIQYLPSTVGL